VPFLFPSVRVITHLAGHLVSPSMSIWS